jgi:hypothetical protein
MLQASLAALATLVVSASFTLPVQAQTFPEGVLATGTMGPTNPPQPTLGTAINQTSMSRLLTVNSIDVSLISPDCIFYPRHKAYLAASMPRISASSHHLLSKILPTQRYELFSVFPLFRPAPV